MIVPDVNVLVFAHRRESTDHVLYAHWLNELASGPEELGLADTALLGFLRVVTNRRIFHDPTPMSEALAFVEALRSARRARSLAGSGAVWNLFADLAMTDTHVRANLVPDAWIAALALAHGGRVASNDRGFARFDRLDWFDPAAR